MRLKTVFAVFVVVFGSLLFGLGFHNIDLAFNAVNLGLENISDIGIFGHIQTMPEVYMSGLKMILFSWALMFLGFIVLLEDLNTPKTLNPSYSNN